MGFQMLCSWYSMFSADENVEEVADPSSRVLSWALAERLLTLSGRNRRSKRTRPEKQQHMEDTCGKTKRMESKRRKIRKEHTSNSGEMS